MKKNISWMTANYQLLILGQTISRMGSIYYRIVLSWYILTLTNSALCVSLYIAIESIPRIFLKPVIGNVINNLNKLKVIICTDFINGMLVLFITFFLYKSSDPKIYIVILLFSFFKGILDSFFSIAINTILPELVQSEHVDKAYALNQSSYQFAGIFGLTVGTLLLNIYGVPFAMLINGISYILSALSEMFIKYERPKVKENEKKITLGLIKQFEYSDVMTSAVRSYMKTAILIIIISSPFVNPLLMSLSEQAEMSGINYIMIINVVMSVFSLTSGLVFSVMDIKVDSLSKLFIGGLGTILLSYICILVYMMLGKVNILYSEIVLLGIYSIFSPIVSSVLYKEIILCSGEKNRSKIISFYGFVSDLVQNTVLLITGLIIDFKAGVLVCAEILIIFYTLKQLRKDGDLLYVSEKNKDSCGDN